MLARSEATGKTEIKRIVSTSHSYVDMVVRVELADAKSGHVVETLTATRQHPFYVAGKGFVPAGGLAIGNSIVTRAGPALVVKSVTWKRRAEGYDVYNFVVEDDHSYFVGKAHGGAWVHNPDVTCGTYDRARNQALEWLKDKGFIAEKPTPARFPRDTPNPNPANGMSTADGKTGFRVEYDERSGAHINVYSGKEKGPHYKFEGTEEAVQRLIKRFNR